MILNPVGFISGMQDYVDLKKFVNIIYYINRSKEEKIYDHNNKRQKSQVTQFNHCF